MKDLSILAMLSAVAAFLLVQYFDWRVRWQRRLLGEGKVRRELDGVSQEAV